MTEKLTRIQAKALEILLNDWRTHGTAPTQSRFARLVGKGNPWVMLKNLADKGYVHQPYEEGPWVPLRDVDGVPVQCEIRRFSAGDAPLATRHDAAGMALPSS